MMKVRIVFKDNSIHKIVPQDHNQTFVMIQTQLLWQNTCFQEEIGYDLPLLRRGGRAVECTGLENRRGLIAHREFESLLLRHITKKPSISDGFFMPEILIQYRLMMIS